MDILVQLSFNSLIAASIYALTALGFNLIFGATKFFNLAHGALSAVGAYTAFYVIKRLDQPYWLAIVAAVLLAGLIGFGLDKILFKPMRKRKASNMVLLVASLGAFTVLQAAVAIIFGSQIQTLTRSVSRVPVYHIAGGSFTQTHVIIFAAALLAYVGLALLLSRTVFGKAIQALSDDQEVATIIGIHTGRFIGYVFFIGSALAGAAGVALGFDTGIQPTLGLPLLLKGVIASIVGGVGSIHGAVLGAVVLGFVENFGIWKIPGEWKDALAFGLLIVFLIFRPRGILGR